MQALKPESWSAVPLPELRAQGKGVLDGCPIRKLDSRRCGQSNCLERQGSLVDVLFHFPRSDRCGEVGAGGQELWRTLEWLHTNPSEYPIQNKVEPFDRTGRVNANPMQTDLTTPEGYSRSIDWSDESDSRSQSLSNSEELFPLKSLGHLETARIRCTPGTERVRVCTLSSIRNGWMPLPKRGVKYKLPNLDSQSPLCQKQIKDCIDSITQKINNNVIKKDGKLEDSWPTSMGFRSWRFSSFSTSNINEASTNDMTPSLLMDALPWSVWRGQRENVSTSPPLVRPTLHIPHRVGPALQRTTSVPDFLRRQTQTGFSSITIASSRSSESGASLSQEALNNTHHLVQPVGSLASPNTVSSPALSSTIPRFSQVVTRHKATLVKVTDSKRSDSAGDCVKMRGPGMKMTWSEQQYSYTDGDRHKDNESSCRSLFLQPSYHSCIQVAVPQRSLKSVLYLDKSLTISIAQPENTEPAVHRSTLFLYIMRSSHFGTPVDYSKTQLDLHRCLEAVNVTCKLDSPETDVGYGRGPSATIGFSEVPKISDTDGIQNRTSDLIRKHLTKARQTDHSYNGNADELCCPLCNNSTHRHPAFNIKPVKTRTWGKQSLCEESEERPGGFREVLHVAEYSCPHQADICHSPLTVKPQDVKFRALGLKEALEMFRPDFISRSQDRVRRLEQRSRQRALHVSNPDLLQGFWERSERQRIKCTKPHPLSDNLFKPRERFISGREMHLRSRRIYKKLPEVTKKKEEEKRRAVSQTNRLRADIYKKKLLDQILQR